MKLYTYLQGVSQDVALDDPELGALLEGLLERADDIEQAIRDEWVGGYEGPDEDYYCCRGCEYGYDYEEEDCW